MLVIAIMESWIGEVNISKEQLIGYYDYVYDQYEYSIIKP